MLTLRFKRKLVAAMKLRDEAQRHLLSSKDTQSWKDYHAADQSVLQLEREMAAAKGEEMPSL